MQHRNMEDISNEARVYKSVSGASNKAKPKVVTNIDLAGSAGERGRRGKTPAQRASLRGREGGKKSEVPITKQIKRERDVGTEVKARRGGAACSSCNRRIRIICFEEAEAEGESGCVRGLRMGCTNASDAPIFFEPALLHIKNVHLRMRKINQNHSEL